MAAALRALRWRADLSQRELAANSEVPAGTVARLESGVAADPKLRTVERLVRAAGARLAILDLDGSEPVPLATDGLRDDAGRRYPAHLDPAPTTWWRKGRLWHGIGFRRNRWARDHLRRWAAGEDRWDMFTEIRRLGPGDAPILAALRAGAAKLDPAGAAAPDGPPLSREAALRYLRDPSLRHWVAESGGRVYGHLVAHVHYRHAGPPTMVVSEFGVLPEHRNDMIGTELVGALRDEAVRLAASEVIALARGPAAAAHLRRFGFATRLPRRRDHSSKWLLARISS